MPLSPEKKVAYFEKMKSHIDNYTKLFMVSCDNVGSKQMQQIRGALRGKAEVLMGKNTMMRRIIKDYLEENEGHPIEQLLPKIVGNVGFVFTNGDLGEVR